MSAIKTGAAVVLLTVGSANGCGDKMHAIFPTEQECLQMAHTLNQTHDTTSLETCVSIETAKVLGYAP